MDWPVVPSVEGPAASLSYDDAQHRGGCADVDHRTRHHTGEPCLVRVTCVSHVWCRWMFPPYIFAGFSAMLTPRASRDEGLVLVLLQEQHPGFHGVRESVRGVWGPRQLSSDLPRSCARSCASDMRYFYRRAYRKLCAAHTYMAAGLSPHSNALSNASGNTFGSLQYLWSRNTFE